MAYEAITVYDQLAIAKDALRGAESDHYRRSNEPAFYSEANLDELEQRIEHWHSEIERLEGLIEEEDQRPADPAPAE